MAGYNIYRDRDGKPAQREWIETVPTSEIATRDADYIRTRLPPVDRVWYEWGQKPQDVPTFKMGDLGAQANEAREGDDG